jgi:hypothetical protein
MSRGRQLFKQRDLTKAVRAVVAAGMTVTGVKVDKHGVIVVLTGKASEDQAEDRNEWDNDQN